MLSKKRKKPNCRRHIAILPRATHFKLPKGKTPLYSRIQSRWGDSRAHSLARLFLFLLSRPFCIFADAEAFDVV